MTNEQAIKVLLDEWKCIDRNDGINCDRQCEKCDLVMDSAILKDAYNMAIKALSQEPCDDATLKDIFCTGCEYKEKEPCDDTVSIRKDVLKFRVGNIVAYNVEWLKKHWQMEMDIVCGIKPCDDAISRQAAINIASLHTLTVDETVKALEQLPSVTQKSGWIPVSERLPEDSELVLFSTKTDRVFEGRYFADNTDRQWYAFRDETFAWNNVVIAWMPLPKPYEPQESEE